MLNKLAKFYATQIKLGKMTIDEVPAKVRELTRIAHSVPGVRGVHAVRCRLAGTSVLADLHVTVDPDMTVRDGHALSHQVRSAILEAVPQVTDVIIHLEPDSDPSEKTA